MADLSQYSTEELMRMAGASATPAAPDLSSVPTEHLLQLANQWRDETRRNTALAVQGIAHGVANIAGTPIDLANAALNAPGPGSLIGVGHPSQKLAVQNPVGGSESMRSAVDYLASVPSRAADAFNTGSLAPFTESRPGLSPPSTPTEKAIYGAGEGIGGALGTIVPGGILARTAPAGSSAQAIGEALAIRPVLQTTAAGAGGAVGGATDNPYLGLATSLGLPVATGVGARAITPMGPAKTASEVERRRLVEMLQNKDFPLQTGQILGNNIVQGAESVMGSLPFSGGMQRTFLQKQRQDANRLVTSTTGEPLDTFTTAQRTTRRGDLSNDFQNFFAGKTISLDPQLNTDINSIVSKLPPSIRREVDGRISDLKNYQASPNMTGEEYQNLRSRFGEQAVNAGDREVGNAMRSIRNALDAAAGRSLPPDQMANLEKLRTQWGNYKTIESAMQGADAALGDIPLKGLAARVDAANRRGGAGDLTDIAHGLSRVVADQLPQSGTQPRSFMQNLLTGGGLAGAGGGAAAATGAVGVVPAAAGALAIPPIVQMALENPATRAWAGNRVLGNVRTAPGVPLTADLAINAVAAHDPSSEWNQRLARLLMQANEMRR